MAPNKELKYALDIDDLLFAIENKGHIEIEMVNGDVIHCLSMYKYNQLKDQAAKSKLLSRILLAEEEIEISNYIPFDIELFME